MSLVVALTSGSALNKPMMSSLHTDLEELSLSFRTQAMWNLQKQTAEKELNQLEEIVGLSFDVIADERKAAKEAEEKEQAEKEAAQQAQAAAQHRTAVQKVAAPVQKSTPVAEEPVQTSVAQEPVAQAAAPADNIWHVSYVYCQGASAAPADGSVGLWAEGWFIAHNYTANGQMISSMPEYVEVDGQVYQYAYSWQAGDMITEDEVAQIRSGGGITFQTCITSDLNLMVHYNPVGAAYPYTFTYYPYCSTDTAAIGYYPEDY